MTDNDNSEREAFEAWFFVGALKTASERMGDGYRYLPASQAWKAWQAALAAAPARAEPVAWRDMATAPKDSTMLRLLVAFTEHPTEDNGPEVPLPTIGANSLDNTGVDEWQFAGWSWQQDCFTQGEGTPVGWLPMIDAAPQPAPEALTDEQIDKIARDAIRGTLHLRDGRTSIRIARAIEKAHGIGAAREQP